MNKLMKCMSLLSFAFLPVVVYAQQTEMSKKQVHEYMHSYDREFEKNRLLMQQNVEEGILSGELKLAENSSCRTFLSTKLKQVSSLDVNSKSYHKNLGSIDGKWDGRQEGCQEGFQLMADRIKTYKDDMKNQWIDGTSLGEKIAALELHLFSSSPLNLETKCLDARRVQGLTKIFLSDEVPAQQQISEVQLDCQSQARVVAQRFINHKQRLMAETQQARPREIQRSAASIHE